MKKYNFHIMMVIIIAIYGIIFYGASVYAFDRVMPYLTKRNFEVIQNNFQSVRYQKLQLPPSSAEVTFDVYTETASVLIGTVNTNTGNYVTHIIPSAGQITVGLSATSLSTTEVSVIAIIR